MHLNMLSAKKGPLLHMFTTSQTNISAVANSVDQDQTASSGAV